MVKAISYRALEIRKADDCCNRRSSLPQDETYAEA